MSPNLCDHMQFSRRSNDTSTMVESQGFLRAWRKSELVLKCNLNHAIHMRTSKKMMIFSDFLLTLFFIFWGWNSKKAKYREILHFEKHSSLCNRFGKRTMFFVFSFFHFLCKFRISTSPLSVTKNNISTNFQSNFFGNIG